MVGGGGGGEIIVNNARVNNSRVRERTK